MNQKNSLRLRYTEIDIDIDEVMENMVDSHTLCTFGFITFSGLVFFPILGKALLNIIVQI